MTSYVYVHRSTAPATAPERFPLMEFNEGKAIRLRDLRKSFGQTQAVAGVDLDIADGEFFSMLGPSGSGKTTVLRLIAGFELTTAAAVSLGGRAAPAQR